MGSKLSCCVAAANSPRSSQRRKEECYQVGDTVDKAIREEVQPSLQHISDREPEDSDRDPSTHPTAGPLFLDRSSSSGNKHSRDRSRSSHSSGTEKSTPLKKCSSCSTIFLDDSTVSQPNLKNTIKCVALAVYYHIKNRSRADGPNHFLEIFDEKLHPLSKDAVPVDYGTRDPEHRHIYKFVRTLFTAAQLTSECAIITLVYIERLLTYAEIEISPSTWKRIVLGAILLSSKVWDDQAVWNVDYCQILKEVSVEDMNELERQFLEFLQFNINVPSSVYAKYYFTLRVLADKNDLVFPSELLTRDRAIKLEAMSRITESYLTEMSKGSIRKTSSLNNIASRRSAAVLC